MKSAAPDSPAASGMKAMQLDWLTLRFSGPTAAIEASYQDHLIDQTLVQVRIALVLGAVMYALFGILEIGRAHV